MMKLNRYVGGKTEGQGSGGSEFHIAKGSDWRILKDIVPGISGESWEDIYVENDQIDLIRRCGGIFVNDAFISLWNKTRGIMFLDGGYGSSKTTYAITRQLVKSMENKYHRCYYGRQVKARARELHSNIITEIKRNGWEDRFKFSEQPTGSTQIMCIATNNKFEMFGCDDTESLKGIDNATDILCDEINQISFESFGMLLTRLRTPGVEWQMVGMFNNCDVYDGHWLKKYIYGEEEPTDPKEKVLVSAIRKSNVIKHHSIYTDNLFQNHDAYLQQLIIKAAGDEDLIKAYCDGSWGVTLSSKPYYKMYKDSVHVEDHYNIEGYEDYNPEEDLIFSFDENVHPYFPCSAWQFAESKRTAVCIFEVKAEHPNNKIEYIAEILRKEFPNHKGKVWICGDATSRKDDVKLEQGQNFFTLAEKYLEDYFDTEIHVNDSNPNNSDRGKFINSILGVNYHGLKIVILARCETMRADLKNVQESPDPKKPGTKDKTKKTVNGVKGVQPWGHFGDTMDYALCQMWASDFAQFRSGDRSYRPRSGPRLVKNGIDTLKRIIKNLDEQLLLNERRKPIKRIRRNGYD